MPVTADTNLQNAGRHKKNCGMEQDMKKQQVRISQIEHVGSLPHDLENAFGATFGRDYTNVANRGSIIDSMEDVSNRRFFSSTS